MSHCEHVDRLPILIVTRLCFRPYLSQNLKYKSDATKEGSMDRNMDSSENAALPEVNTMPQLPSHTAHMLPDESKKVTEVTNVEVAPSVAVLPSTCTRDSLHQNAQQLIDDLNSKRKQDTQLLADYKKALELQAEKSCSLIEQSMFQIYKKQGEIVQHKLEDLFATLDRIAKLETELDQFRQALSALFSDMSHPDQ